MSNPSPTLAALLSFIFPGLGQAYAGQARKGLIWAIPMLLFIVGVLWLVLGGQLVGVVSLGRNQAALLIFNVAFFLYHVAAMIDAYDKAKRDRSLSYSRGASRTGPIALAALVAVTIVLHGFPEMYGIDAHNSYCAIFNCGNDTGSRIIPPFQARSPNPSFVEPSDVASASGTPSASAGASASPSTPGASSTPTGSSKPVAVRTPLPSIPLDGWPAWAQDGRLNILLVGGDSRSDTGLDAKSLRTDSMILLSVDIESGKAALFSFPRNLCTATNGSCGDGTRYPDWLQIPLVAPDPGSAQAAGFQAAFPDGTFTASNSVCSGMNSDGLLTSLWHIAAWCSSVFPGSDGVNGTDCQQQFTCQRAWSALVGTIQEFTGQQIDGILAVNLNGFVDLVSNLPSHCPTTAQRVALQSTPDCYGGLWLQTDPLQDDAYYDSQQDQIPVNFQAGCFYVDPEYSLAYARSRHQDSDYQRERRQQYVIQQVRRQLDPLALLPNIPALLQVAQANLYTTFSDSDISYLAQAASRVDPDRLYEEDFAPAHVAALGSMQAIQDEVTSIFSTPEPQPQQQQQNNPCPAK